MKKYKWNEEGSRGVFWDWESKSDTLKLLSNKQLVNDPNQAVFVDVIRSLCLVVSELIEIEENRNK
jgi:hypothetical protein